MWAVLGIVSFLLFCKLFISYYLGNVDRSPQERPLIFARGWFHATIWSTGLLLLGISVAFLYFVSGWLTPIPVILAIILPRWRATKRVSELDAVIKKCIVTNYELTSQGIPKPDIYRQILNSVAGAAGRDYEGVFETADLEDWDLARAIQYVILPAKGLYSYQPGRGLQGAQTNAAMAERIKGFIAAFERLRSTHDQSSVTR